MLAQELVTVGEDCQKKAGLQAFEQLSDKVGVVLNNSDAMA